MSKRFPWVTKRERTSFLPRSLRARTLFADYQVQFYETVAVPEVLLEQIVLDDIDRDALRAFAQWRMDFPIESPRHFLSEQDLQMLSVMEKILLRGRFTLLSPALEEGVSALFPLAKQSNLLDALLRLSRWVPRIEMVEQFWFDSEEERIFYWEILPQYLGEHFQHWVIPQVEILSLLPPNADTADFVGQRVDFVIMRPGKASIVVEIDGLQHEGHFVDRERDDALKLWDYSVVRIPAEEIRQRSGRMLVYLQGLLSDSDTTSVQPEKTLRYLLAFKVAHQMAVALLQALRFGFLDFGNPSSWQIATDLHRLGFFESEEALRLTQGVVRDFLELLRNVSRLYGRPIQPGEPEIVMSPSKEAIYFSFAHTLGDNATTFFIQNIYVSFPIAHPALPASALYSFQLTPERSDLEYFLRYIFRKPSFREGQYEGIVRLLQGKDVLLLLPTGAGKSMVYQLASFLLPGMTLVIDPLIALMEDQIDNLSLAGVDRCIAVTSQIENPEDRQQVLNLVGQGEYLFVFVAPERFQTVEFREALRTLTVHTPVAMIVVDEAHCVSEWGHDFRVAYLNIGRTSREYCQWKGHIPPLVALTGTASRAVLKDIQRELQITSLEAVITPKTFDRAELRFQVFHTRSSEKMAILQGYLGKTLPDLFGLTPTSFYEARGRETCAGLVFCPHVGGPLGVEQVGSFIRKNLSIALDVYSGKEPKGTEWNKWLVHKRQVTRAFKRNRLPLLVCTKAFGMGIDKPNIRYTVHLGVPASIEAFYQEAGRAGRDRKTAHCGIIVSIDDMRRAEKLLSPSTSVETIEEVIRETKREDNDDVTRILYFHINSFRGIEEERQNVEMVLEQIPDLEHSGSWIVSFPEGLQDSPTSENDRDNRETLEKAIYRLLLIGVFSDYTINYATKEFTVHVTGATREEIIEAYGKYVASYLSSRRRVEMEKVARFLSLPYRDFVLKVVEVCLHFLYDVIEKGRRRAFYEMLLACRDAQSDNDFRQRILRYLETTGYSEALDGLIRDEQGGIIQSMDIFDALNSLQEMAELRGQVSRYLESYPDHPALLMLRALTEAFLADGRGEIARQNFGAALVSARKNYGVGEDLVVDYAIWAISRTLQKGDSQAHAQAQVFLSDLAQLADRNELRMFLQKLPFRLTGEVAWILIDRLVKRCRQFLTPTMEIS